MTKEQEHENESTPPPDNPEEPAASPRSRKKVTFGSTEKIEAPAETGSQTLQTRTSPAEAKPQVIQDVNRFLDIPLEDRDATDSSVSTHYLPAHVLEQRFTLRIVDTGEHFSTFSSYIHLP